MRRCSLHLLPRQQLVGQRLLPGVPISELVTGLLGFTTCLAGVAPERHLGYTSQHISQALQLVVGQRIHGIQQQRADAGARERTILRLGREVLKDRDEEALGLARSGPGRDDDVVSGHGPADSGFLMVVQRTVQRQPVVVV